MIFCPRSPHQHHIPGAAMGLAGFETGPGVVITVVAGAIFGGIAGEEGVSGPTIIF